MTKSIFRYLFAVLALSCVFTSCSDDDDDDNNSKPSFFEQTSTFTEANGLCLTYSGDSLAGKQVVFTPSKDKTSATLVVTGLPFSQSIGIDTLNLPTVGLIPGETTTTLNVDLTLENEVATFAGKETKENCTIEYNGTVKEGALALNVNVKMNPNALTGKSFNLFAQKPMHILWDADEFDFSGGKWDIQSALLMTMMFVQIDGKTIDQALCGVLNEISFLEDGNIQAQYKDAPADSLEWQKSPLNLATYSVESDSTFRLFIHPNQIAAFEKSKRSADLNVLFDILIKNAAKFSAEGIKLQYTNTENGYMNIYLTKETLLPILQEVKPFFEDEEFVQMILALMKEAAGPEMAMVVNLAEPILKAIPGVVESTRTLELGLSVQPAQSAE